MDDFSFMSFEPYTEYLLVTILYKIIIYNKLVDCKSYVNKDGYQEMNE